MPSEKKIIAVIGATGHQGAGLVRSILSEGPSSEYTVRAITNEINSELGQWLKKSNVDVRDIDINDESALVKALEGTYGLFAVTFYWQRMSPEEELRQARNIATAAKSVGVKHVVWSTLEDTRPVLDKVPNIPTFYDKYKVPPFDAKAEADHFFHDSGVPTTYLITPFFWDNFVDFGMGPKKAQDGTFTMNLPMGDKHLAGMASEDIGKCVMSIFKKPEEFVNKRFGISSEALTMTQICDKMTKIMKKTIKYDGITFDDYSHLNFPGARELANMFQYFHDNETEVIKLRCKETGRKLNPQMLSFDQWLNKYKTHIPLGA